MTNNEFDDIKIGDPIYYLNGVDFQAGTITEVRKDSISNWIGVKGIELHEDRNCMFLKDAKDKRYYSDYRKATKNYASNLKDELDKALESIMS